MTEYAEVEGFSPEELLVAKVVTKRRELLVLWAIKRGLCKSIEDFQRHYGPRLPAERLINKLERLGFLFRDASGLSLTDFGNLAVSRLDEPGGRDREPRDYDSSNDQPADDDGILSHDDA